ncbi:MAG: hypothetical protein ISS49_01910 [Anaerolineae bacterium]|nr:hypothetical protein [Anaerolineae bacterium]
MVVVTFLLIGLLALLILLVCTLLLGLGFLGIGWVFTLIFPLGQYEATIVALGTGVMLTLLVYYVVRAVEAVEEEEEEEYELLPYRRPERDSRRKRTKL